MTKEMIEEYSNKYKKQYKKFSIVISIFIFIVATILFGVGLFLIISFKESLMDIIGAIMLFIALIDALLGIKFIKYINKKLLTINNLYAAKKYMSIMGIQNIDNK